MALASYKKIDLINLATELSLEVTENDGVKHIIKKIEGDPDYDKELTMTLVKTISKDRIEREQLEREKEARVREFEREKEARVREFEREKEEADRRERQEIRQYELQKAQLEREAETASLSSTRTERSQQISLKNVMQKFDEDKSDISLFLNLFQRQAEKAGIDEGQYTSHLIPLLPIHIAEIVLRESNEKFDDFGYIKNLLLKRFKLSPENLRMKFVTQQKNHGSLWKDLCFDLKNFLEGWLEGLEITDFEMLKNLMITDQIKKRASAEAKEHFIDSWADFTDPHILAEKLDNFDIVRKTPKRNIWTSQKSHITEQFGSHYNTEQNRDQERNVEFRDHVSKPSDSSNWREKSDMERTRAFEKKEIRKCFICGSSRHLKNSCTQNTETIKTGTVNFINTLDDLEISFGPYLSKGRVNNKEITILRDTGTTVDIVGKNAINHRDLNGKYVLLRQPLDASVKRLPLANIKLETEQGLVFTTAAVIDKNLNMHHYLLGNETFNLLEQSKSKPKLRSAITQRMKKRDKNANGSNSSPHKSPVLDNANNIGAKKDEKSDPPVILHQNAYKENARDLPPPERVCIDRLANINSAECHKERKNDTEVFSCRKKEKGNKLERHTGKQPVFRISKVLSGNDRRQLVRPTGFRKGFSNDPGGTDWRSYNRKFTEEKSFRLSPYRSFPGQSESWRKECEL